MAASLRQRGHPAHANADAPLGPDAANADSAAGTSSGPEGAVRNAAGRRHSYADVFQGQHWAIKCIQYAAAFAALGLIMYWALWLRHPKGLVLTKEELARHQGQSGQAIYVAILGEVFDVSSKAETYGPGKGYHHFAGRDGSRAFITGRFKEDLTDDVADFTPEQCLGLVEWRDFYHKTYTHKGRVAGAFFPEDGQPTQAHAHVEASAVRGKALREEKAKQKDKWPSCSMKYTQEEGGSVWCDDDLYPRKLFVEMEGGQPSWRCACFKELGWSDLRQVYPNCSPEAHKCQVSPPSA